MSSTRRFWTPQVELPSGPFTDIKGGPVKPPRWAWNPALLTPAGRNLARGLQILIPTWDGDTTTDLLSAEQPTSDDMSYVDTPYGMARRIDTEGSTLPATWASDDRWKWKPTDDGITVAVFVDKEADAANSFMMGHRDAVWTTGTWIFGAISGDMRFSYWTNTSNTVESEVGGNAAAANTSPIFGDYNMYAYSSKSAAAGQMYRNGVKLTMSLTGTVAPTVGNLRGNFGGIQNDGNFSARGNYLLGAKWNRKLSDDEHALLAADPFILLRRDMAIPAVINTSAGPFTDIKGGPVKPPRWAHNPALLTPEGRELSRGLVDLLPFWDDDVDNLGHDHFDGASKYAWVQQGTWPDKHQPTSHGMGWLNTDSLSEYIEMDVAGTVADEWITDWSELWVVTCDANTVDSGLRSWGAVKDLLWFDAVGSSSRIGITGTATVYGPLFHTAADNGTTYVIVVTNNDTATHTDVWVDGTNHISSASKVSEATDQKLFVGRRASRAMSGTIVSFGRWNRILTDAEIQSVSFDPFQLLRRDMAIPTVLAIGGGPNVISVGFASETEVAQVVSAGLPQTITVGFASEIETSRAIGAVKEIVVSAGVSLETETSLNVNSLKPIVVSISSATEVDSSQIVLPVKSNVNAVGFASEVETSQTISVVKPITVSVGFTSETEVSQTVVFVLGISVGFASETETSQSVSIVKPIVNAVGFASETETSWGVGASSTVVIGFASEVEAPELIGRVKIVHIGSGVETETTFAALLVKPISVSVGATSETEFIRGAGLILGDPRNMDFMPSGGLVTSWVTGTMYRSWRFGKPS